MMLIDWEAARWHNPVLYLYFMICSSTSLTLRKNYLEEILRQYYSTFTAATDTMGAHIPSSSYEDFKDEWRSTAPIGTISGIIVNLLALSSAAKTLRNTSAQPPGDFITMVKFWFARMLMPILAKPSTQFISRFVVKKRSFDSLLQEMRDGSNKLLTSRVRDLLMEANDNGVFDLCIVT
nr:uncharacterized protein LOC128688828 [Cherax quadricarinatus]